MRPNNSKRLARRLLVFGGAALIAGSAFAINSNDHASNAAPSLNLKIDSAPVDRDTRLGNSFAPIIKQVAPSVVKIAVTATNAGQNLSQPEMDFFRRFFGGNGQFSPGPQEMPQHGLGSGVIVSADGYILTNNHVVRNAKEIEVALNDGRSFKAKVIGTDPQSDIALVKIDAQGLPFVTLADSEKVEVGDVVLAIGNPFGIGQTVTSGIVSAKNRVTSGEGDEDFIQTDAAINPGNSGGALVDTQGRLVGVNTAILSRSGGNQGIGFAVPSSLCRWVMESLVKSGQVDRGFLGVVIQNLTPELAKAFKVDRTQGALVSDVSPSSPAETAGIKSGDVITQFNTHAIQDASQLKLQVAETPPGTKVPIQVDRGGENKNFDVTVRKLAPNRMAQNENEGNSGPESQSGSLSGVSVADLDRAARTELKVPSSVQGAVITQIDQNSASYDAGLREGDVITEINHQPVKSADEAVAYTQKSTGGETLVKVWSHGGSHYVAVNEPANG